MRHRRHAFTLIELLAVIAILGLLMGILLPSLSSARQAAKASVCLSTLKNMSNAFVFYLNENSDTFPPVRLDKGNPADSGTTWYVNEYFRERPRWQWFLEMNQGPVIDPKPHQRNPTQVWGDLDYGGEADARRRAMTVDSFNCPSLDDPDSERDIRNGAYGYNYQYLGNSRQDSDPIRWDNFAVSLHQINSPARTIVVADSRGAGRRHGKHSYTLDPPRLATEKYAVRLGPRTVDVTEGLAPPALYAFSPVEPRHRGRGNAIFVDGHGEPETMTESGYDWNEELAAPQPVLDTNAGGKWNNKLWTGTGRDEFAERRAPSGG